MQVWLYPNSNSQSLFSLFLLRVSVWWLETYTVYYQSATSKQVVGNVSNIDHLLTICWEFSGPGIHVDATWHAPAPRSAGQCSLTHLKNCSRMARGIWQRAQGVLLASKSPRSQSDSLFVGCAGTSPIRGGPDPNIQNPMDSTSNVPVPNTIRYR